MVGDSNSKYDEIVNYLIVAGLFPGLQPIERTARAGSVLGKGPNEERQFDVASQRLLNNYLIENAKCSFSLFERSFRIPRSERR